VSSVVFAGGGGVPSRHYIFEYEGQQYNLEVETAINSVSDVHKAVQRTLKTTKNLHIEYFELDEQQFVPLKSLDVLDENPTIRVVCL